MTATVDRVQMPVSEGPSNTGTGLTTLQSQSPDDVVITLAIRSPLCKAKKGGFKDTRYVTAVCVPTVLDTECFPELTNSSPKWSRYASRLVLQPTHCERFNSKRFLAWVLTLPTSGTSVSALSWTRKLRTQHELPPSPLESRNLSLSKLSTDFVPLALWP